MSELFGRVVRVKAGIPGAPDARQWSNEGPEAIAISFEVTLTSNKRPSKSTLNMINMSDESIGFLEQPGILLFLEAGYRGMVSTIAQGNVAKVDTEYKGTDTTTTITIGDGEDAYLKSRFNYHFGPGTTSAEVISRIQQQMGLGRGYVDPNLRHVTFPNGVTFTGSARDALDRVVKQMPGNTEWSIQSGQLQTLADNNVTTADTAILLSADTGLKSAKKVKKGTEIICLLIPAITPGRRIEVRGRTVTGFFVARKVVYAGSGLPTGGGEAFETRINARELSPPPPTVLPSRLRDKLDKAKATQGVT